jgi:oligoendopeptidase F
MQASTQPISGPSWDLATEYKSTQDAEFASDVEKVTQILQGLEGTASTLLKAAEKAASLTAVSTAELSAALRVSKDMNELWPVLGNLLTFVNCQLSVNAKDAEAKAWLGKLQELASRASRLAKPLELTLKSAAQDFVEKYLSTPETAPESFNIQWQRLQAVHNLAADQEDLAISLAVNGITAWGNLYDSISGSIECDVNGEKMGIARAVAKYESTDRKERETAFRAVNKAWAQHQETGAAIVNALAGWRHELYRRRSHTKTMHFLDAPLHDSKISRATLDAMMDAVDQHKHLGQQVMRLQAKAHKIDKLGPWDLFAPAPTKTETKITFDQGCSIIADAFSSIDPKMGEFVRHMQAKRWIEGTVGDTKRPGAYCTHFLKSRTPRVYMTYTGGMKDLLTLAHELGHAFHAWEMRNLPLAQLEPPMTLAETASIFAETVTTQHMLRTVKSAADKLPVAWSEAQELEGLLLNIPARYTFEKKFYERRPDGPVNPQDLCKMMEEAWQYWYGDTLSEYSPQFWLTKLHFSISELSFYNFPYLFGYLFSLGVYARSGEKGFYQKYCGLLEDTGRMTAEDVAKKHLGVDLTKPDFWQDSLKIAATKVEQLQQAISA